LVANRSIREKERRRASCGGARDADTLVNQDAARRTYGWFHLPFPRRRGRDVKEMFICAFRMCELMGWACFGCILFMCDDDTYH
jgi:hypothetical protein